MVQVWLYLELIFKIQGQYSSIFIQVWLLSRKQIRLKPAYNPVLCLFFSGKKRFTFHLFISTTRKSSFNLVILILWVKVENNLSAKSRCVFFSFFLWSFMFFDFPFPLAQICLTLFSRAIIVMKICNTYCWIGTVEREGVSQNELKWFHRAHTKPLCPKEWLNK